MILMNNTYAFDIEEKNPLKQGLKLKAQSLFIDDVEDWREESIKTRIETSSPIIFDRLVSNWREESIKTRIETFYRFYTDVKVAGLKRRIH